MCLPEMRAASQEVMLPGMHADKTESTFIITGSIARVQSIRFDITGLLFLALGGSYDQRLPASDLESLFNPEADAALFCLLPLPKSVLAVAYMAF